MEIPGQSMRHRSDLVQDAKLNTTFGRGVTRHLYHDSSTKSEKRKAMIEERWAREKELGNGTYGRVWLERCVLGPHENELRAVKRIVKKQSGGSLDDCTKELEAVAKFSHRNYAYCFVRSSGWFENDDYVYIAMEFMALGDLQKHLLASLPEAQTGTIISQLLEGLQFMHMHDFTHRDLKPSNILVHRAGPDWWVKIGDFGISKRADNDSTALRTMTGTFGYIAPEVFGFYPANDQTALEDKHSYTSAVDIWSLGEICFRLVTNQPTFANHGQLSNYASGILIFPVDRLEKCGASYDCIDFIRLTMSASPSLRPSAEAAWRHSWVRLHLEPVHLEPFPAPETEGMHSWEDVSEPPVVLEPSAAWSTLPPSDGFSVPMRPFASSKEDLRVSDELLDEKPSSENGSSLQGSAESTLIPKRIREIPPDAKSLDISSYTIQHLDTSTGKSRTRHDEAVPEKAAGKATTAVDSQLPKRPFFSFKSHESAVPTPVSRPPVTRSSVWPLSPRTPEAQAARERLKAQSTPKEQAAHERRKAERRARRK